MDVVRKEKARLPTCVCVDCGNTRNCQVEDSSHPFWDQRTALGIRTGKSKGMEKNEQESSTPTFFLQYKKSNYSEGVNGNLCVSKFMY